MKRDDTKKNFTALSGNDLATVLFHYLAFLCQIAISRISEVFCLMRYGSVQNAEFHLFCSENRNFYLKSQKRYSFYFYKNSIKERNGTTFRKVAQ